MSLLGIIGGTGAVELFPVERRSEMTTPFGAPSARPCEIRFGDKRAWFLARHGTPHRIPPHRVNYRANIHVLRALGVTNVLAINAVGAVDAALRPGSLVVPDQLIDYTSGRLQTYSEGGSSPLRHVDFTEPFAGRTRETLLAAAEDGVDGGCVAVTNGPRLETAAEVARMARDGCDLVGMTSMPEAVLAREAGLDYASLCVVANPAAGVGTETISVDEIHAVLDEAMESVREVVRRVAGALGGD